jgi:type II secretory pathway pseudopilin PulG
MHRKALGSGGRRARRGFTMVELAIAMSMLMIGLVSAASATMRMQHLRKQNRERVVAQNALRSMGERIHAQAYRDSLDHPDTWAQNVLDAFGPGGTLKGVFDVEFLSPPSEDQEFPGTIQVIVDETTTDTALGMDLGMPRDLNGDGDAADLDVSADACILPVVLRIEWKGQQGLQEISHGFFVMGY